MMHDVNKNVIFSSYSNTVLIEGTLFMCIWCNIVYMQRMMNVQVRLRGETCIGIQCQTINNPEKPSVAEWVLDAF